MLLTVVIEEQMFFYKSNNKLSSLNIALCSAIVFVIVGIRTCILRERWGYDIIVSEIICIHAHRNSREAFSDLSTLGPVFKYLHFLAPETSNQCGQNGYTIKILSVDAPTVLVNLCWQDSTQNRCFFQKKRAASNSVLYFIKNKLTRRVSEGWKWCNFGPPDFGIWWSPSYFPSWPVTGSNTPKVACQLS